jgi:hypothetical protein
MVPPAAAAGYIAAVLRPRIASAAAALAFVVAGCSDDAAPTPTGGPAFQGVSYVVPDADGNLIVSWKPSDDAVDYRVYVSKIQGRELKTSPAVRSSGTSVLLKPDALGARYFVIVRAANKANVEDTNQVEKSAIASPDKTPPNFPGLKTAAPDGNAGVKLTWDAATDDFTPTEAIVYDVFAGRGKNPLVKLATTLPGDTTISFSQLGNPGEQFNFAVRARDVAGNVSAEVPPTSTALGPDATPPAFDGCDTLTPQGSRAAVITWKPATDNATAASAISYEIYLAKTPGAQDLNAPAAKVTAATSTTLTNLDPATTYYVLCKARDAANNLDVNKNEKTLATGTDVTAPTFAGLTGDAFDEDNRSITLQWTAATDDQTPPAAIVYDVFESKVSGTYDFTTPKISSAPGATSITLTNLTTRSTLYWVVRARDATGNRDTNLVEKTATTKVSFAVDVQGVLDRNCAVVGCHITGTAPVGLNMAPGFAFANLVDVSSRENAPMKRIPTTGNVDDSFLWMKITDPQGKGSLMPAPQTGNTLSSEDKNIIRDWIEGGAKAN